MKNPTFITNYTQNKTIQEYESIHNKVLQLLVKHILENNSQILKAGE